MFSRFELCLNSTKRSQSPLAAVAVSTNIISVGSKKADILKSLYQKTATRLYLDSITYGGIQHEKYVSPGAASRSFDVVVAPGICACSELR